MTEDPIYLHDVPLEEAWSRFTQALEDASLWQPLGEERIPLEEALGRITSEPIWAYLSSPHYHAAAMDGFALRARDTSGASDRAPVTLEVGSEATYVDTGDPMPEWADAVVPIEHVEAVDGGGDRLHWKSIRLRNALAPWTHVRAMGEDMVATELVLPAGRCLRPVDLGAIAGCGHPSVQVWRKPRVAILPTGSELVPVGSAVKAGQILEYNSLVLAAQIETWGGSPTRFPIIPDDHKQIQAAVRSAAESYDLILVNAGSSAGSEDFTARVVQSLGDLLVHGVAVRPGHPVILGMIHRTEQRDTHGAPARIPIIGVPGYPVSAALTGEIFVEPLLSCWLGRQALEARTIQAVMTRKVHSSLGDEEYLRVTVGRVGDRVIAAPLTRGAGVITSLVRADGVVRIASGIQGIQAGEEVTVQLYCSLSEIERTILILGSHDLTIDLIAQFLSSSGTRLTSANIGSLGGLIALSRGEAHLAGSHLLDPESGEYNLRYIRQYLPGLPVVVVALVYREQGLMIHQGNPKGIQGLADLVRSDVRFINRQRGAGTRLLLDYNLQELGLSHDQISGYENEEYTHLSVAAAISSGRVDCGLGIQAAATSLGLDFIPLFQERYDLVIPEKHYESPRLSPLLDVLQDEAFRRDIEKLPGYDTSDMGKIIAHIEA
jgi:putative molybdopterin biosynthesis protein